MKKKVIKQLREICAQYPEISFAYLFGSLATGDETPLSDVDVAIHVREPAAFSFDRMLQFHGDCCRRLQKNDIDVVLLNSARNLMLLDDIIRSGVLVYTADQKLLDEFELRTLHAACDFRERHSREMFN